MKTWIRELGHFFRRYFLVLLISIIVGNLLAWKNMSDSKGYFEYVIKVRTRVDYYDPVRAALESVSARVLEKGSPAMVGAPVESYRNENFYYLELKIRCADSSSANSALSEAIQLMRTNRELNEKYFGLIDNYDRLLETCRKLIREADADENASEKSRFDLRLKEESLLRNKIKTEEKVQVYFPSTDSLKFAGKVNSASTMLAATVLFLVIGLFASVAIDRFRN